MKLRFTKMQGVGNDFVVLDAVRQSITLTPQLARRIADRHFGIGCDQLLIVERAPDANADFLYRIFNADGGEVEQCGNGARCFARFVREKGLTDKDEIRVQTRAGIIAPRLERDGEVTVDMGAPIFEPARVPFDPTGLTPERRGAMPIWPLESDLPDGESMPVAVLSMGNPHAVQLVDDVDAAPVATLGPVLERHRRFPSRVNAGFLQIIDRSHVRLRVYERGAGETLACGTGACAAVVAGIRMGLLDARVVVATRGGHLTIAWAGADNAGAVDARAVFMTGPAVTVFDGEVDTEALEQR